MVSKNIRVRGSVGWNQASPYLFLLFCKIGKKLKAFEVLTHFKFSYPMVLARVPYLFILNLVQSGELTGIRIGHFQWFLKNRNICGGWVCFTEKEPNRLF